MTTGESLTDEDPNVDAGRPSGPLTREILDHISDAVVALDRELHVIFVNQQAREYLSRLGVEQPDAGGPAFWDALLGPVDPESRAGILKAAQEQTRAQYELYFPPLQRWLECRVHPSPSGVTLVARDITDRREAELELAESAGRLQLAMDSANLGDWQWDAATDEVRLSERAAAILGHPERTRTTWTAIRETLHPDDRERARAAVELAAASRADYQIQYRIPEPGQPDRWISAKGRGVYDAHGQVTGMLGVVQDVTAEKQAETELREQSRIIEAVHRTARVLAGELDLQKLLQAITDAATEVSDAQIGCFFYTVPDDGGEAYLLYTLSGVPKEAFSRFPIPRNTAIFAPTFHGEGVVRLDNVLEDPRYGMSAPYNGMPEGHLPVRSYLAVPVTSRSGEVLGALLFGHSEIGVFTERHERILTGIAAQAAIAIDNARLYKQAKDAEYASRRHADELAEANRRKDEFISMLSHELRNPLGAISNAVAVIHQPGLSPEKTARLTGIIERQTRNLTRMVDDLLDVSRLIHGMIELRLEQIELGSVLTRAVDSCRDAVDARGHRLTVSVELEPVMMTADPTRLEQILCNLLDNAAKYTEPGGVITVTAEYEDSEEQPQAVLRIKDSGIGISPELLPRIFDLFTQAERSLDRAQGGLGIGLTVVLRLVELHGGTIQAFSEGIGKGSEFVVRLPALRVERKTRPEPLAQSEPQLLPMRVLVVDDLVDAAETLKDLLEAWGQEVQMAHTGPAALVVAEEFRPHVVLLDLGLPGWDGFEVARRLRELPEGGSLRLIAVTGYGQDEDVRRTREAGFAAHFTKPVDLLLLRHTLARIGAESLIAPHNAKP